MADAALFVPESPSLSVAASRGEYRCECGYVLRVFGRGRHCVFFEAADTRLYDPVINRACPGCGCRLPGKGRPYAASEPARGHTTRRDLRDSPVLH